MKKFVSVMATCLLVCIMITGLCSGVAVAAEPQVYDLTLHYPNNPFGTLQYKNDSTASTPTQLNLPTDTPDGRKIVGWYEDSNYQKPFDKGAYVANPKKMDLYAKPDKTDFKSVVAKKPEIKMVGASTYYRIKGSTEVVNNVETYYSAIQKWKWVTENPSKIKSNIVIIEEDLDFTGYTNLKALSHNNTPTSSEISKTPITFSIVGGVITGTNKVVENVAEIKGFDLELTGTSPAFIDIFDGKEIRSLHFVNCNYKATTTLDYVGGLVGVMYHGLISQVSFTNSSIKADAIGIGGIVGKVINGDIYNCDYQGTIDGSGLTSAQSYTSNVGGLVGEIVMGDRLNGENQINKISIWNSYFIGSILAGNYAGGIIGNIDFAKYNYNKDKSIADIIVEGVYAKLAKITTNNTSNQPYGILGNIVVLADDYIVPGPEVKPQPGQPPLPPVNALPIQGIKFNKVLSSETANNSTDTPVAIRQFPIDLPKEHYTLFGTLKEEQFALASSFKDFDNSIWIMPEKMEDRHFELKYKFGENLLNVQVEITGNVKSSSTIVEKDNNSNVAFVYGDSIVMTILEQDGVHVQTIKAVIKNRETGVLEKEIVIYTAPEYKQGKFEFANYDVNNTYFDFIYKDSKLIIKNAGDTNEPTYILGNKTDNIKLFDKNADGSFKYDITFSFDFSNNNSLAFNNYKTSINPYKDYKISSAAAPEKLDFAGKILFNFSSSVDTATPYVDKVFDYNHNNVLNLYIEEAALADYLLEGVAIKGKNSIERLESKPSKGWVKKGNVISNAGKWYEHYELRLNYLTEKLHNYEDIEIQLLFIGRPVSINDYLSFRMADQVGVDLVKQNILNVAFVDNANEVQKVANGTRVKLRFTLSDKGATDGYIFNLFGKLNEATYAQLIQVSQKGNAELQNVEVRFVSENVGGKTKKYFETVNEITAENGMQVSVNLAKKRVVNIKEVNGLYNAPSFIIHNVPVILDDTYVAGYCHSSINYDFNKLTEKSTPNVYSVDMEKGLVSIDSINLKNLFSIDNINNTITFNSIMGIDNTIQLACPGDNIEGGTIAEIKNSDGTPNTAHNYYTGLKNYKIDGVEKQFADAVKSDRKKGIIKLTDNNDFKVIIELYFDVRTKNIEIAPNVAGTPWAEKTITKTFKYGDKVNLTRFDYISNYENDFKFDGWVMAGSTIANDDVSVQFDDAIMAADFATDANPYKVEFKLTPYYKLNVTSENINRGKIYLNGNLVGFGEDAICYFTNEYNASNPLKYELEIVDARYSLDVNALKNANSAILEINMVTPTKYEIIINHNDFGMADLNNYKQGKLNKNIDITYIEKKYTVNLGSTTLDDNGEVDGFGIGGTIFVFDENGIEYKDVDFKIAHGKSLIFKINAFPGYNINWQTQNELGELVPIPEKFIKVDFMIDHMVAEYRLDDIQKDVNIYITYKKQKENIFYRVNDPTVEVGRYNEAGELVYGPASLADFEFKYSFNFTGIDKTKIPYSVGDTVVSTNISFNIKNDRFKFETWLCKKVGSTDAQSNNSPYFVINGIDGNYNAKEPVDGQDYELVLRLVEIRYEVKVDVPVGNTIKITSTLDGKTTTEEFTSTEANREFDKWYVRGTNVVLSYVNKPDFIVDRWELHTGFYTNAQVYNLNALKSDAFVTLNVVPIKTEEGITEDSIKVKHNMFYDAPNAQAGRTQAFLNKDSNTVTLKAFPSSDSQFVKWFKKNEKGEWVDFENNNEQTIVVTNDASEYAAFFELKTFKLNFGNEDLVMVTTNKQNPKYGDQVVLEFTIKPGYVLDKVIINGNEEIMLGNQKKVTLYNVDKDMDIKFVYRKVGQNEQEATLDGVVKKLAIATIVVAIILTFISKKVIKATGYKKKNKIKINID